MKKNLGTIDRVARVILALIMVALFAANIVSGTVAYVLLAVAAIFVLTSAINFCPLYAIFGINTCPREVKA